MKRLLVFTDIHGYFDEFMTLYGMVNPTDEDKVIYLGDYIDRGPKSKEMLDFLIKQRTERPQDVMLIGNHEMMMLLAHEDRHRLARFDELKKGTHAPTNWLYQGGQETLYSFLKGGPNEIEKDEAAQKHIDLIPQQYLDFADSLELNHQEDGFFFVHAGIRPGYALDDQDAFDQIWIRYEFTDSEEDHGAVIVHGHTPGPVDVQHNRISLDTGIAYPNQAHLGKLTAMDVYSKKYWQV